LAGCSPALDERPGLTATIVDNGATGVVLALGGEPIGGAAPLSPEQTWSTIRDAFYPLAIDQSPGWLIINYQAAANDLEAAIVEDAWEALAIVQPGVTMLTLIDR